MKKLFSVIALATTLLAGLAHAERDINTLINKAKNEGKLYSIGMSDSRANWKIHGQT